MGLREVPTLKELMVWDWGRDKDNTRVSVL